MTATFRPEDHAWMAQALRLAAQGLFTTTPNPRVGCVLVRDGQLVGSGWHRRAGGSHAEVHALAEAGAQVAAGATAYVTLEPCSHHGRTPPCADALIAAGVSRVVAAMTDLQSAGGWARPGAAGGGGRERRAWFAGRRGRRAEQGFYPAHDATTAVGDGRWGRLTAKARSATAAASGSPARQHAPMCSACARAAARC